MNFREFYNNNDENREYSDLEVANFYFYNRQSGVREIAKSTGRSIGEMYRILRRYGSPNRRSKNHQMVISLFDSGLPISSVANLAGYSSRHVRNILNARVGD